MGKKVVFFGKRTQLNIIAHFGVFVNPAERGKKCLNKEKKVFILNFSLIERLSR